MRGDAHVAVVEAGAPAQPLREPAEHVAADLDRLVAAHLLARLLDVAEVGEEETLLGRDHAGPFVPVKPVR